MGTGPRGGKRVREAAEAAAAAAANGVNATDEELNAAGTAAAAPPEWRAPDPAERPSSKPRGNPMPDPKTDGAVDPEDVDRKSSAVLTKKGFAAGAVARACASVRPTADDEKKSFNEQKRRRIAAVTTWLVEHADLWELPRESLAAAKRARGEADDTANGAKGADDGADDVENRLNEDADDDALCGADASERARALVKQGILPVLEAHVRLAKKAGTSCRASVSGPTGSSARDANENAAGAGAQDRERTGKSLRALRLEKAARRAEDLCPKLARGEACAFANAARSSAPEAMGGDRATCAYSHDIEKFMREKPPDLKGACPFGGGDACRFGRRCRFYGSHEKDGDEPSLERNRCATSSGKRFGSDELNALTDETQRRLARCAFPLPRSDAVLRAMDVPVKCVSRTQAARLYGCATETKKNAAAPPRREGFLGAREPRFEANRPFVSPPPPDFRGKLVVAPLTTVGNMPFRRACVRAGADVTVSEMAMAANLLKGDRREWALVRRHESEACFGVQVCGGYPDLMARCGELLDETTSCDFVDINMGCPIDGVCAKGAGASLFKDEEGLLRCERTVRCASRAMRATPLTIKIRMGYEDDPSKYVAHEVLAKARGWGAAAATLHGRTRQQRYSRDADWKYIERCAAIAARDGGGLPLIGNGDIFGWRDYERRMRSGNVATCMIGRGALVKPWVFTEIKERRVWDISATERLAYFERFARDGLEHWGADEKGVETTRRFMLEWMSYTHRYVPVGLIERGVAQKMTLRPMPYEGRNELETLLASEDVHDWIAVSEMFLGKPGKGFAFVPKHGSNSYSRESAAALRNLGAGVAEQEEEEEAQNG